VAIEALKQLLDTQQTTSERLVIEVFEKAKHFQHKNAIAVLSPLALEEAKHLDDLRDKGVILGPLHGIPILIKDNILYNDTTPTTCNSYAFHDFIAPYDATIVERLKKAGAIIVGKANLSEFAYFMSKDEMPSGYGSMYGQVLHPFDESIDPYGSSTGSAVAVKLGIVDLAIGSETNGSLMAPAFQSQIVSLKPSFGYVSKHGIMPVSSCQDTAGPMANCVMDCAYLMEVMANEDPNDLSTFHLPRPQSFLNALHEKVSSVKVGLVSFQNYPYDTSTLKALKTIEAKLNNVNYEVIHIEMEHPTLNNYQTMVIDFKEDFNAFLKSVQGATSYQNLDDVIQFNINNKDRALKYGQSILEEAAQSKLSRESEMYRQMREQLLKEASLFEETLSLHQLDAIITPSWFGFAPIYGNPSLCVPEGLYDGLPKASVWVSKRFDDVRLLQIAHHYETKNM
jgi:amidase